MAPPVFKTGLAGIAFAGRFDSFPPPPNLFLYIRVFGHARYAYLLRPRYVIYLGHVASLSSAFRGLRSPFP